MNYRYKNGEWEELKEDPFAEVSLEKETFDDVAQRVTEDWKSVMERMGYNATADFSYGCESINDLEVYQKKEGSIPPWIISFSLDSSYVHNVIVDTLPDLMNFLAKYIHLFTQSNIETTLVEMQEKDEKR